MILADSAGGRMHIRKIHILGIERRFVLLTWLLYYPFNSSLRAASGADNRIGLRNTIGEMSLRTRLRDHGFPHLPTNQSLVSPATQFYRSHHCASHLFLGIPKA